MNEYMSLDEMEREYPGEWVLIAEPTLGEMTELLGGVVVFHGREQEEVWAARKRLGLRRTAVWFMGPAVPEGFVAAL